MKLNFGIYKGYEISDIPDESYICWLAKPKYSGKFYKSLHSTELNFKVPFLVIIEARKIVEKLGYKLNGETWSR